MKTAFKKSIALALSVLMLFGAVPGEAHAEGDLQQGFYEEGSEFDPFGGMTSEEEQMPEIFEEEPVYAADQSGPLFTEQDRQAVLHRNVGDWKFPVEEEYFDDIADYAGCRGGETDYLYGQNNYNCISHDHGTAAFGNDGMDINVPYGAKIFAPTDGTLYRSPWADSKLGVVAVIEHSAGNGYSYYVILENISDDVIVSSGSYVNAGDQVATAYGRLHYAAVMAPSGKGQTIAENAVWELSLIAENGWLTESYGTGMICVNPSFWTESSNMGTLMRFLDGPFKYTFVQSVVIPEPPAHTEHVWDASMINREATHFAEGEIVYICTACGAQKTETLPRLNEHSFDQQNTDPAFMVSPASCQSGAVYVYSCVCGEKGSQTFTVGAPADHLWDNGTVTTPASHTASGVMTYACTVCGTTRTEVIASDADHVYDQQNIADAYLAAPASCQNGAVYFYSCVCGEKGTETFTVGEASGHQWDNGTVTTPATHTASGVMTFTCTVCGTTETQTLNPSTEHVYNQQNTDPKYLKEAPSCTSGAVYYLSCECGETGTETFTVGEAMGHIFSDAWTTSETHHWHAALCEHTTEVSGHGEHTWDNGTTTKEAGHMVDGETTFTCTTCGLTRVVTIPGQPHVFDQQNPDEKYLAATATCTQGASYYKSCAACGEKGTETFTYGDPKGHTFSDQWSSNENQHWQAATCEHTNEKIKLGDHIWDGGVITVQPTGTTAGERTFSCVVCKATKKEALQPTTHEHTFDTRWTANESYHWHAATCEHTGEMSGFGIHAWDGGVITKQPSHFYGSYTDGEKMYTCATCGVQKRETIPANHTFDQRSISAQFLKTPASCTSPAVYYVSCQCGAKGTETFTYGSTQGHTLAGTWSTDETYHWRTCLICGSKGEMAGHYFGTSNICITCGYTKQESHVHASHLGRVPAKPATCTQPGNVSYYICECGKWFTDTTTNVEITDRSSVNIPATGHVDRDKDGKCDVCKERIATDEVSYTMTEGKDATWLNNASQGLVFRSNSDYSKFDHVEVDGSTISSMNYTISSGSTIVELSANYMKRLNVGQHSISIVANDGRATANFTIKQATAAAAQEKGGSVVWVVVAVISILAMIAAACIGAYLWYTSRTPKKGGKFSR